MTETAQQIVMDLVKAELSQFRPAQIEKVLQLLEEGNTVPFIARYRKEATGS
ncbi:MAG TPA: Tex-like N-terminal domain-containing protein, partial [Trichococcus flocculiformis]|nr:Tex-like N-terminal domain-containing protein [Trichococcus flocculiformis]